MYAFILPIEHNMENAMETGIIWAMIGIGVSPELKVTVVGSGKERTWYLRVHIRFALLVETTACTQGNVASQWRYNIINHKKVFWVAAKELKLSYHNGYI